MTMEAIRRTTRDSFSSPLLEDGRQGFRPDFYRKAETLMAKFKGMHVHVYRQFSS